MIESDDIEAAVNTARAGLSDEHSWIADSALHERAYVTGLYMGLTAVVTPARRSEVDRLVLSWLAETLFARPVDEPFQSTVAADCLSKLKIAIRDEQPILETNRFAAELRNIIERALTRVEHHCNEAVEVLNSSDQLNPDAIEALETHLRALACPLA